jgi:hypothetical protein
MAQQIQLRRDTAANWTSANPVLAQAEVGIETDTDKFKFGDGTTAWTSLDYIATGGGGGGAVDSVNGETGVVVLDASDVGAQPVDSDLTAIAALTTTAYGRAFLALADAAAARTALALGNAATLTVDADLATLSLPASTTITTFGASLIDDASASNARTTLGLGTAATTAATDYATAAQGAKADSSVQALSTVTKINGPITQAAYLLLTPAADTLYVIVG